MGSDERRQARGPQPPNGYLEGLPAPSGLKQADDAGLGPQRLTADAPLRILIAPMWCLDKNGIRLQIERELQRRDTWQGKALGYALENVGEYQRAELAVPA